MLRLAFDFIITWRETRTRPNAYMHYISAFIPCYISFIIINGRKLTQYGMKTGFYRVIEC